MTKFKTIAASTGVALAVAAGLVYAQTSGTDSSTNNSSSPNSSAGAQAPTSPSMSAPSNSTPTSPSDSAAPSTTSPSTTTIAQHDHVAEHHGQCGAQHQQHGRNHRIVAIVELDVGHRHRTCGAQRPRLTRHSIADRPGTFVVRGPFSWVRSDVALERLQHSQGLMRQIVLPTSSATSNPPRVSTATPTGRPYASPSGLRKPVSRSIGMPVGLPLANGTNTTL